MEAVEGPGPFRLCEALASCLPDGTDILHGRVRHFSRLREHRPTDRRQLTPLQEGVESMSSESVVSLLSGGADAAYLIGSEKLTALHHACWHLLELVLR